MVTQSVTRTILVAGTASHVGKSTVVAGLCRVLANIGVDVAPFKAQNMSNNARVAINPRGQWGEIGISQYVQARSARIPASTDMNPVLLKPRGNGESQLIIQGEAIRHVGTEGYYQNEWEQAREAAVESYRRLASDHEVVIAEGAGSPAEINLHNRDLANVETAQFADADILLLVDIDRGGAFASLYGTLELAPAAVRERTTGAVITKFRGDRELLDPGINQIESLTGVPIIGVLPFDDPGLPAEDSVSLPDTETRRVDGADDGITSERAVTIGVVQLPHISNFSDVDPLARVPGVRVVYLPPTTNLSSVDAVIIPGTKNTVDDLLALRRKGFDDAITAFNGPIIGLCGGYQILGNRITNASIESTGDQDAVQGLGLLPVDTQFSTEKRVARATRTLTGSGPLRGYSGRVTGYEIHMGEPIHRQPVDQPLGEKSAAAGNILGTYLHGLFENEIARDAFIENVYAAANTDPPDQTQAHTSPYERVADLVADNLDVNALGITT